MIRSRLNTPGRRTPSNTGRPGGHRTFLLRRLPLASAISAILAGAPLVHAAGEAETGGLEEIVVTAQKKVENLQNVPIAIEVFDSQKLEQLNVVDLDDYVKYSPSVSYVRGQGQGGNGQPGSSHVYMRGVVSGGDGNHSGSQPSVGTYLDEQPVTTIDGTVDMHIYDIQRIEVLEGPQGTLYGASSESGTIRIITNKPDPTKFEAGYDLDANHIQHGGTAGWEAEGFINIPLASFAAIRLVGWDEHDSGYINNIAGTDANACIQNGVRTFPTWAGQTAGVSKTTGILAPCPTVGTIGAGAISNAAYLSNHYNTVETRGGRAALKIDAGDNWTITPTVMGQSLATNGFFGYDPAVGDLDLVHFGPENSQDAFMQSALTVEGKFSDFDLVYAGGYMKRTTHSIADYSDYSEFYDRIFASGANWTNGPTLGSGAPVMPQELVITHGYFEKWSHELRLSTPQDLPVKGTFGVFIQRQLHDIWEQYTIPGYNFTNPYGNPNSPTPNPDGFGATIPGLANTVWLTDEQRVDRDQAAFFQGTWDITSQWSLNGGLRYFKYDNSLEGFYGYSANYFGTPGQGTCFAPAVTPYAPCTDLDRTVSATGTVPRVNITYQITPDKLVYATYSKGFRPGGVNRTAVAGIGPYQADFLTNYEVGWKTQWFDHHLRWNAAAFWEDWKNFQFSFLGPSSLTIIENGGSARIKGIENEIEWAATSALTLSTNFTFLDPRLTQNVCGEVGVTNCPGVNPAVNNGGAQPFTGTPWIGPEAPAGSNLPVTPKFKANVVARYAFDDVAGWKPFSQLSWVYQTQTLPLLLRNQEQNVGMQPAYGLVDFAAGVHTDKTMVQFFVTNVADRRAELTRFNQSNPSNDTQTYIIPAQPRTFAIKFGQKF
jgi:outer membrane receptor protein involved in Fe transport